MGLEANRTPKSLFNLAFPTALRIVWMVFMTVLQIAYRTWRCLSVDSNNMRKKKRTFWKCPKGYNFARLSWFFGTCEQMETTLSIQNVCDSIVHIRGSRCAIIDPIIQIPSTQESTAISSCIECQWTKVKWLTAFMYDAWAALVWPMNREISKQRWTLSIGKAGLWNALRVNAKTTKHSLAGCWSSVSFRL